MTCLVEIRDGNGQVGILSTHLPEFAAMLKMLLKQAGYTTKTKCYTDHPEETQ